MLILNSYVYTAFLGQTARGPNQTGSTIINPVLLKCRRLLESHYGENLVSLVLFGSAAREDQTAESDLDLLVVLCGDLDYFVELRQITDLLYSVQLEAECLISAKPALVDEYELGAIQLYRNAKRDGVLVGA